MSYSLRLFGTVELNDPTGVSCSEVLSQPKRAGVLAYLAAARPFGYQRRDRLLAVFWPESDQTAARRSLNQTVHFLRRNLGADCVTSRGADEIGLAAAEIECDTMAFQAALDREHWADALAWYRGDLLDGFFVSDLPEFEHWLEEARVAYRDDAIRAAWALSGDSYARQEMDDAKRWARWASARTPYDESSFRRYLELLGKIGDRAAAVQAYSAFTSRLKEDLEISPSPETSELANALRDGTASLESDQQIPSAVHDVATVAGDEPDDGERFLGDGLHTPDGATVPRRPTGARTVPSARVVLAAELWSRVALIGAGASVTLGVAYLAVIQLGLPNWLFVGAATLVGVGLSVMVATAVAERRRSTTVMQAGVAAGGIRDWLS